MNLIEPVQFLAAVFIRDTRPHGKQFRNKTKTSRKR